MIDIKHLRAFLTVAELAHQGRAAEALSISQSTLSRQITALEDRLDIRQLSVSRESLINLVGIGQGIAIATDACQGVDYPGIVFRPIKAEDAMLPVSLIWVLENNSMALTTFRAFAKQRSAAWTRETAL